MIKIVYNRHFPVKGFIAINLFGVIFARTECYPLSAQIINHERIHTAQMREMLYLFFYLWYVLEWVVRLVQCRNRLQAYHQVSFEIEAYSADYNLGYLKTRKFWSWTKYL